MKKQERNVLPYILISIMLHVIVLIGISISEEKKGEELIEVSFGLMGEEVEKGEEEGKAEDDEAEAEAEVEAEAEREVEGDKSEVKGEEKWKDTKLKERKDGMVSDEKSEIKMKEEEYNEEEEKEELKEDLKEITKFQEYAIGVKKKLIACRKRKKKELEAQIFLKISREGRVLSVRVWKSSGDERYDEEGVETVKRASPFESLPSRYKREAMRFVYRY
jgi:TonB family protein